MQCSVVSCTQCPSRAVRPSRPFSEAAAVTAVSGSTGRSVDDWRCSAGTGSPKQHAADAVCWEMDAASVGSPCFALPNQQTQQQRLPGQGQDWLSRSLSPRRSNREPTMPITHADGRLQHQHRLLSVRAAPRRAGAPPRSLNAARPSAGATATPTCRSGMQGKWPAALGGRVAALQHASEAKRWRGAGSRQRTVPGTAGTWESGWPALRHIVGDA